MTAGPLDVAWKPDALLVIRVEIDPSVQGRGIGTRLMADLLAEADARGVPVQMERPRSVVDSSD